MQFGGGHKLGAGGVIVLALISLFALFVAFAVVPAIARNSGMSESGVTYIVAGLGLVIAFGSTLAARAMNSKK